jgi:hypothetical protein
MYSIIPYLAMPGGEGGTPEVRHFNKWVKVLDQGTENLSLSLFSEMV